MVAQNPLFAGWSLRKFKATVINDIWPEVLFFTGVAASKFALWCHIHSPQLCSRVYVVLMMVV